MATIAVFMNIRLSVENLNNCKVNICLAYHLLNTGAIIEEALATAIMEVYFQDYKTAYSHDEDDSHIEIDKSHFEHLI
jgi:hypothetical protein